MRLCLRVLLPCRLAFGLLPGVPAKSLGLSRILLRPPPPWRPLGRVDTPGASLGPSCLLNGRWPAGPRLARREGLGGRFRRERWAWVPSGPVPSLRGGGGAAENPLPAQAACFEEAPLRSSQSRSGQPRPGAGFQLFPPRHLIWRAPLAPEPSCPRVLAVRCPRAWAPPSSFEVALG